MMKTIFFGTLLACLTICNCEPPTQNYGTPLGAPISSYGTPNYHANNDHHDYGEPKSYEFGYQVKDDYSGNNYNRQESSDGNQVRGEYRVALPDGRTQIVTYWADWQSGFHADVRYEGTAHYPEQYNNNNGGHNGGYNDNAQQYNYNNNQNYNNNGYNGGYSNGGAASSSVSIKDYSNSGTPYNTNNGYNYNNNNNNYDSYNTGNFAKTINNEYGAP